VKLKKLLLIGFLCVGARGMKADYLWAWHGFLGEFKGSFEVPDAEMQPHTDFGSTSPLFFNSISITSTVENVTYQYSTASYAAAGGYFAGSGPNDYILIIGFDDASGQTGMSYYSATATMTEHVYSDGEAFGERGYWSYTYIPEPSAASLLIVAAVAWFVKRKRLFAVQGGP
jgi:hypothetical protein